MDKKIWKSFESRIKIESQMQGITCIKVPEAIMVAKGRTFRRKTEFDYCAGIDGVAAFFDAKSSGRDLYIDHYILEEGKIHQFSALCSAGENLNIAGYLIYFYQEFQIVWANIALVKGLAEAGVKKISVETPGLKKQMDNVPINLRTLLWEDRARVVGKLCNT
jgi:penicillin-binding protein-related factor A (putative recombinase)